MRDFSVLVLSGAHATSVSVTLDLLAAAAALAVRAKASPPRWAVYSPEGGPLQLGSGVSVVTERLPARPRNDRSVWVLPGLGLTNGDAVAARLSQPDAKLLARLVARHVRSGGSVAASCSAVFLLQKAGLLSGRRVTTTWWLAPLLQQLQPDAEVDAHRMVCVDGPVTTSGAALGQADLMLHLLRERLGSALTDLVARMMLVEARPAQAPFIVPEVMASGEKLVAQIVARIDATLPNPPSIARMARDFCMTERTLARHIHRATGKSTQTLVLSIKQRRARELLENSRLSVEQIAEAVGYSDSSALRRLMKRVGGATPSRFRPSVALR